MLESLTAIEDEEPHSAALNMALDEALLVSATVPVLRVYSWERAAVSFGYFGKFAAVHAGWPGRELVRRMTGGGVVPHGDDITYTLVVPAGYALAEMTARESYEAVHGVLARWLCGRGVGATLAGSDAGRGNGNCFESPVAADVLSAGRKLAGAAQRRTREGLLLQGSIQEVPRAWAADLPQVFGAISRREFTPAELALAQKLAGEKYGARAWLERV